MNKLSNSIICLFVISLLFLTTNIIAKNKVDGTKKIEKTKNIMGSPSRTHFNINNISTWIYNDGQSDNKPDGNSGFIFPKGSNKAAVFQSGFVWGATINGEKRVGGATYDSGLRPGRIIGEGVAAVREDESLEHVRIYRVRRDYADPNADFSAEVNDGEGTADDVFAQYELDWNNWPAEFGAPYDDVDSNGTYEPLVDIPGVPGSDQTVWFVANDLDVSSAKSLYGSDPMGIEMQATFWGYNRTNAIGNTMFRKYKIINKSANTFDSMYVSMWADPDLGDASDDYSGCDVGLSLMYSYNAHATDNIYGEAPPAVGFDFFQGPIVPAPGETAIFDGKHKADFKNLPMSVHYFFINGDDIYTDPPLGDYEGTLQFHRLFRGQIPTIGAPFVDPTTGLVTKFTLSGDPVSGTGWIDGILHPPGDRRQGMVAGPFNMAAGDTQEVVVAEIAAFGRDNLDAITELKNADFYVQEAYNNFFEIAHVPVPPSVNVSILEEDTTVTLKWEQDAAIETFDEEGYQFQGYNIYQVYEGGFPLLLKTFDIVDGITTISQLVYDPDLGYETLQEVQFGTDSGLEYEYTIDWDYINNEKLLKGKSYYFAVTPYTYTSDDSKKTKTSESYLSTVELIYRGSEDGIKYGDLFVIEHTNGSGDAKITVNVIDSDSISGNKYEVGFSQQHYYLAADGKWHETNFPDSIGKSLSKDISPAYLSGISYVTSATTKELKFTIHNIEASPDYAYCDGIELTFPAGVTILSADVGGTYPTTPVIDGQTVTWGAEDTTENGPFHGGELLTVTVSGVILPLTVDYVMWDDGWGWLNMPNYGGTGEYKNAIGSVTITEETYYFRTENHWNLTNITTDDLLLEKQRVFGGIDVYADFWDVPSYVGLDAAPIIEGFQINVDGNFGAPVNFLSVELNEGSPSNLTSYSNTTTIDIQNYTIWSGITNSYAIDNFGVGTYSIDELQQDYELRFTGVYDNGTTLNGVTVYQVIEGGSMATCFRMVSVGALATNPLNPNYGTVEEFLVRIPFEVWNVCLGSA